MNPSSADTLHTAAVPAVTVADTSNGRFKVYTPIVIAAIILVLSVGLFACWGIFGNKSIKGTWTLHFLLGEQNCSVSYTFEDENTCYFHNGGSIRKGSYQLEPDTNGDNDFLLTMTFRNFNDFGTPAVTHRLRCRVEGTAFGNRRIRCTDLSGMIFDPDDLNNENAEAVAQKKASADYVEADGTRCYVFTMYEDKQYTTPVNPIEGAKQDKKLLGIWLEQTEDPTYDNTFAFYEDNTIRITYRDRIYKGCYTAHDGECIFNVAQVDGGFANILMTYKLEDDELTININDVPAVYVPTDNIYAFDNGIK